MHFTSLFLTHYDLVNYPDDERDSGRNMSVMNNTR